MLLIDYIAKNKIKVADFALKIGVTRDCVHKYIRGERKPIDDEILKNIAYITKGEVTANDFYGITPKRRKRND